MRRLTVNLLLAGVHKLPLITLLSFGITLTLCSALPQKAVGQTIAYSDKEVRISVISDGAVRMEWSPTGHFTNEKSLLAVLRDTPRDGLRGSNGLSGSNVNCKVSESKSTVKISTPKMCIVYKKGTGRFSAENLTIQSSRDLGRTFIWHPGTKQTANLKGTSRTLDGYDGDTFWSWGRQDKEGKKMELEDGLLARDGWTFIDDSENYLFDPQKDGYMDWVKERQGECQDWYFLAYGTDYTSALTDYTRFAGRVPLPPRYAFGYWWSRYWDYSDHEMRDVVKNFNNYGIPLDVLVVDMDWHWTEQGKGGWTGYTWNDRLFPDHKDFLSWLKAHNLKITMNVHPADGVFPYEEHYKDLAQWMGDSLELRDESLEKRGESEKAIPYEGSNRRFMEGWYKYILHPLEDEGVDFWWYDWQQFPNDKRLTRLSNTWWLNYVAFTDMQNRRTTRPMLYHRWGGLGNHRYQVGFSGDSYSTWASLDYQPYFNSTASNVLYGYWSHDLGGHMFGSADDRLDPELYVRWMQLGTFLPIMRSHSSKDARMNKEPWSQGEEKFNILRNTILQRYELVPYIYTMARKTYETGISLCRPLYYDYGNSEEAYAFRNEYMFGDNILVAPITSPMQDGISTLKIWLPAGNDWYELCTGTLLKGGQTIERRFLLDEYPVYVKAGSIIPEYGDDVRNLSGNDEAVTINVFPQFSPLSSKLSSLSSKLTPLSFKLYEDAGDSKDYATQFATTEITTLSSKLSPLSSQLSVTIAARQGSYEGMPATRDYRVKLVGSVAPQSVTVDGKDATYKYDGESLSAIISLDNLDVSVPHTIVATFSNEEAPDLNNGLVRKMRLMAKTMTAMKFRDAGINYIEHLGEMGSLAEALEYHPEQITQRVNDFNTSWDNLPDLLDKQNMSPENKAWFLKQVYYK